MQTSVQRLCTARGTPSNTAKMWEGIYIGAVRTSFQILPQIVAWGWAHVNATHGESRYIITRS